MMFYVSLRWSSGAQTLSFWTPYDCNNFHCLCHRISCTSTNTNNFLWTSNHLCKGIPLNIEHFIVKVTTINNKHSTIIDFPSIQISLSQIFSIKYTHIDIGLENKFNLPERYEYWDRYLSLVLPGFSDTVSAWYQTRLWRLVSVAWWELYEAVSDHDVHLS